MIYFVLLFLLTSNFTFQQDSTQLSTASVTLEQINATPGSVSGSSHDLHYLQAVATYEPGPGPGLLAQYVYSGFPSGFTSIIFGWKTEILSSVSYTHFFDFDLVPNWRRLSITPTLFSDFEPNRLLNGDQLNERRNGGNIHVSYNHRISHLFRMTQHLTLEFSRIRIQTDESTTSKTAVTSLESGHQLIRTTYFGYVPASFLFDVRILVGKNHENEAIYSNIRLGSRFHHSFSDGFDLATTILAERATKNIPLFEQPSFGGSPSVRGYRRDAILGHTHVTFQQEFWSPIPGTMGAVGGVAGWLRNIRLASFFDAGAIYQTLNTDQTGIRTGAGLGIRIRTGGIVLQADWGHRLIDIIDSDFSGSFHISIRPNYFLFW